MRIEILNHDQNVQVSGHSLRKPCQGCGASVGRIETRNGQDCIYCSTCGKYQYNAPKTETGRAVRTISTVHKGITDKQRDRIFERASWRCELCGAKPGQGVLLHVGHLLSVKRALELESTVKLTDQEINSDENLAAMCEECNLGIGETPVPLRLMVSLILARVRNGK